jgi:integrase
MFVNVWWERSVKEKGLAPKTLDDYRKTIARYLLPDWGKHRLEEFEQNVTLILDMQATLRRMYGPATAQRAIGKLSMLFNAAVRWNILRVNPVMMVRDDLPVYRREQAVPLTPEQTICLLNTVEGHCLCALYHIALTLGLRLGEILGLQWSDIDWQAQTITIRRQVQETSGQVAVRNATKTDAGMRVLPLPPRLLSRLRQLYDTRGDTVFLFPSEEGTLLIPSNFERHWRGGLARSYTKRDGTRGKSVIVGVRQKAGLPPTVKFHHLRHTVATRLMEQGTPDEIRDAIMGHGKKGIRGHYAHATIQTMREALEKYERRLWALAA